MPAGALLVGKHHQIDALQLLLNGAARRVQAPADQLGGAAVHVVLELDARQPGERVDVDGSGKLSRREQWIQSDGDKVTTNISSSLVMCVLLNLKKFQY